jgi:splicing factor 3B subunit 3
LNNVVKKSSKEVNKTANLLIPITGGERGPSGLLVCSENSISYLSMSGKEVTVPIPRRYRKDGDYSRGNMITCHALVEKKTKTLYFLQTEEGDVLFVDLIFKGKSVEGISISYFDSCQPCVAMCVLAGFGYFFMASEFGNHHFYHLESLDKFGKEIGTTEINKVNVPLYNVKPLTHFVDVRIDQV